MSLKQRLSRKPIVLAPGVYDPLSAKIAAQVGFEALYVSGAGIAYTRLGRPDIGLVTASEVVETIALIRDVVDLPLILDGDTGFGNALNMQRTVRDYERAGASAIQIEDQTFPKRCGHLSDKTLVSASEMVGKIKAALDARRSDEMLIVARTDAIAVEGFERALDRARLYAEAGADVLFVEAPRDLDQMAVIGAGAGTGRPMLANMVEGGKTPLLSAAELDRLGYGLVIFPAGVVRMIAKAARDFYATLKQDGSSAALADRMFDFDGLNGVIGTAGILEAGKKYQG
jgi:2-methylisocitrate lyase-like PEP mutase family enzyme